MPTPTTPPQTPPKTQPPTPPSPPPPQTPSLTAAQALLDHLQTTGHRDRLKEWLSLHLATSGWTDHLHSEMHRISTAHQAHHHNDENTLPALQLAHHAAPAARAAVPEAVKVGLMRQLVQVAREFQQCYAVDMPPAATAPAREGDAADVSKE